jgi:TetR/AcrR family transcriptional repressor of nem operon
MRNPELTKEKILKKSGLLFNTRGYKATSISHITDATGFTKGAIYRHFKNKEVLEKETLFHLSEVMFDSMRSAIKSKTTAPEKLTAVFYFFETYITNPPVKGGCPLMNVAIEADDAHPILRKAAQKIMDSIHQALVTIIDNGIKYKQIKPSINAGYYATIIIASLEGAIMMSKLRGNNEDIKHVIKHLENFIKEIVL